MIDKVEINLLPEDIQEQRKKRLYGQTMRRMLAGIALIMVIEAGAVGSLSWWLNQEKNRLSEVSNQETENEQAVLNSVRDSNNFTLQFEKELSEHRRWTPYVEDATRVIKGGVTVQKLAGDHEKGVLEVAGSFTDRDDLLGYQKSLERLNWVDQVEAPLSNLQIGQDTEFKLIVQIKESGL